MMTGAKLLEKQLTDERQLRTVQRMTSAGSRMTAMIEQLLDLTRARMAGGMDFARSRAPVDVCALVQRSVDELRIANPHREIVVQARGLCTIIGDADRLLQLFSNLVGNAVNHGAAGTPISITVDGVNGSPDIVVRVANRGVIPSEILPTIFDPFRSRQRHDTNQSPGLGLGLFISRQIVIAHGGQVTVESSEATGTVFTVRLPG
jgi:signal transduction histidine kinase